MLIRWEWRKANHCKTHTNQGDYSFMILIPTMMSPLQVHPYQFFLALLTTVTSTNDDAATPKLTAFVVKASDGCLPLGFLEMASVKLLFCLLNTGGKYNTSGVQNHRGIQECCFNDCAIILMKTLMPPSLNKNRYLQSFISHTLFEIFINKNIYGCSYHRTFLSLQSFLV